jgi:outer membrane protein TolC
LGTQKSLEAVASRLSQVETTQDVEMLVKQLYFSILRDQDTMSNINLVEEQFKRLMNDVVPRFQIGRAPSFDLVKVRSALFDLTRTREVLKSQLAGERAQLAEMIGLQADESWALQPISHLPEIPAAKFASLDFHYNPTFSTLNRQIEASDAAVGVAEAARLPALSAALEYGLAGQTPSTMVPSWNGYAQLRLTFFDWGLISTQVAQAKADSELARKRLEAETQRIESDFIQSRALAEAHLDDQKRLQKLLPELKRASDSSIERYRKAAVGIIEATDATSLWLQNLLNERAAYYGYLADLAHLERVTGHGLEVPYGL